MIVSERAVRLCSCFFCGAELRPGADRGKREEMLRDAF